jgi:hypothetical protein
VSAIKWNKNFGLITNKDYTETKNLVDGTNQDYIKGTKKIRVHTITEGTKI